MPVRIEQHPSGELRWVNVKATLGYEGKQYTVVVEGLQDHFHYHWEDGNYGCDCNRSLFIRRYCEPNFPDMGCGETIELIDLEETDEPLSEKLPAWGDDDPINHTKDD